MPDDLRSPIKHHLVLHRIDPEQGIRRFYCLMIERDLFGTVRLVRNWGRIGTNGQEKAEEFANEMRLVKPWRPSLKRSGGGDIRTCDRLDRGLTLSSTCIHQYEPCRSQLIKLYNDKAIFR